MHYTWRLDDSSWTLEVQLPAGAPETCPVLDVSEALLRLSADSGQILCVPLPEASGAMAKAPVPKWSKKKRLLSMKFATPGWKKDGICQEKGIGWFLFGCMRYTFSKLGCFIVVSSGLDSILQMVFCPVFNEFSGSCPSSKTSDL